MSPIGCSAIQHFPVIEASDWRVRSKCDQIFTTFAEIFGPLFCGINFRCINRWVVRNSHSKAMEVSLIHQGDYLYYRISGRAINREEECYLKPFSGWNTDDILRSGEYTTEEMHSYEFRIAIEAYKQCEAILEDDERVVFFRRCHKWTIGGKEITLLWNGDAFVYKALDIKEKTIKRGPVLLDASFDDLIRCKVKVEQDGSVTFLKCVYAWVYKGREVYILLGNNWIGYEIKTADGIVEKQLSDNCREYILSLGTNYDAILDDRGTLIFLRRHHTWVLNDITVNLLETEDGRIYCKIFDSKTKESRHEVLKTPIKDLVVCEPLLAKDGMPIFLTCHHKWTFPSVVVYLLSDRDRDKLYYKVYDFQTKKFLFDFIDIPPDSNLKEWIEKVSTFDVVMETDGTPTFFQTYLYEWNSNRNRVRLLHNNEEELIWQVFDKETALIHQFPVNINDIGLKNRLDFLKHPSTAVEIMSFLNEKGHKEKIGYKFDQKTNRYIPNEDGYSPFQDPSLLNWLKTAWYGPATKFHYPRYDTVEGISSHTLNLVKEDYTLSPLEDPKEGHRSPHLFSSWIIEEGDNLLLAMSQKEASIPEFAYPIDFSSFPLEQQVSFLRNCDIQAVDVSNKAIKMATKVFRSNVDNMSVLDENVYGITIVDTQPLSRTDVMSWFGHAVILIEGVVDGEYFMHRVHMNFLNSNKGTVHFDTIRDPKKQKIHGKTRTWLRTREVVEKMMADIQSQVKENPNSDEKPEFSAFAKLSKEESINCIIWCVKILQRVGILLNSDKNIISYVLTSPTEYTHSQSLKGNEHVWFYYYNKDKRMERVDVSVLLREKIGHKDWVVVEERPFGDPIRLDQVRPFERFRIRVLINGKKERVDLTAQIYKLISYL